MFKESGEIIMFSPAVNISVLYLVHWYNLMVLLNPFVPPSDECTVNRENTLKMCVKI